MTKMILHQRESLDRNSNIKAMKKKLVICGNQRSLYALARQTILRILSLVFKTTQNRRC